MEGENQNVNVNTGANNEPAGTNTQQNQNANQNDDKGAKKLSNFDEFLKDSKNQAEFDRRVQKAIDTAKTNWQEIMDNEKSEAEKLAKMNKEQKLEYQAQKAEQEKANALAKLNAYELKEQALKVASEKGLDVSLLNFFDFSTAKADEINIKIDEISIAFNKAVEKAVNERLKEDTPISKTGIEKSNMKEIPRASY